MTRKLALLAATFLLVGSAWAQTDSPSNLRNELRRAAAFERAGEFSSALGVLAGVLERSPAQPGAILALERIYRRQGRLWEVLPVVERALEVDPASLVVWQVELRVLDDLGRAEELRDAGERWLRLQPRTEAAYREYASVLRGSGSLREAERVLERGRHEVDRPSAFATELADIYLDQGRWAAAADEWLGLTRSSPGMAWEVVTFKLESLNVRAVAVAEALFESASEREATQAERKLGAIAALYAERFEDGRVIAAALLLELGARERQEFMTQFARVAARRSQPALVAWAYRQQLNDVRDEAVGWELARQIVRHDLTAGDTTAALDLLSEFAAWAEPGNPAHRWASSTQVRLHAFRTDTRRAERALRQHIGRYEGDPELPLLALVVAEANIRRGRLDQADRVLSLVPTNDVNSGVEARMAAVRAQLALYAGRYDEARQLFEVASAMLTDRERSEALRFLGFLRDANEGELDAVAAAHRAILQDQPSEAHGKLAAGLRRAPESRARPALLLWAGQLALEAGASKRGEELLRRIPERYPRSGEAPVALITLADALAATDQSDAAIKVLETLIIDYPDSALTPIGRRRLAELKQQVPRS